MSPLPPLKGVTKVVTMKDIEQMSIQQREKFRRKMLLQDAALLVIESRHGGRLSHGFMPFLISLLHKHGHEWMQKGMIDHAVKTVKRYGTISIPAELSQRAESASVISPSHPFATIDEEMEEDESASVISSSYPVATVDVAMLESASVISSFEYPYLASESMDTTATAQLTSTAQSSQAPKITSTAQYIPRAKSVRAEGWKADAKLRSIPQSVGRASGGRPKGSTKAVMVERRKAARDEKEKAAKDERDKAVQEGQKVAYQILRKLMKANEVKGQLEIGDVVVGTTCGEPARNPLEVVEPIVVETCIRSAVIPPHPMKKKEVLEFAHSIISGTEFERDYIEWLKKYSSPYDPDTPLLTDEYFEGFWRRNKSYLKVDQEGYIRGSKTAGDNTEASKKRRSDMDQFLERANTTAAKKKRFDNALKKLARCYECVEDEQENYVRCPYTQPYKTKRFHYQYGIDFQAY
jgi:hypothetical protein